MSVTETDWQRGIAFERNFWETSNWQQATADHRSSEWSRHLGALGLDLRSFAGQDVLDVGCGPTGVVYFLQAARRTGADALADVYRQWNGQWGEPIDLIQAHAEHLPFNDGSYDAVCCINCIDHTRDPHRVISELARVTRPGGTLILHVDLDSPLRKLHKRVRPRVGLMHPHSLTYGWLHDRLAGVFQIDVERRDPLVFRPGLISVLYEAYWDGLMFRLTHSERWVNHIWLRATRRG